jgi:hypothetical protein
MLYLGWKSANSDPLRPRGELHCTFCWEVLQPPFIRWYCSPDSEVILHMCAHCCRGFERGLGADMAKMERIKEAMKATAPSLVSVQ